jgi:membrane-associated phospholipid phosphatase
MKTLLHKTASADRREVAPLAGWPGWRNLGYAYGILGPPLLLAFVLIYGGANYVTGLHDYRVRLHLEAERQMPLAPEMVLFYNSFHAIYLVAPFVLRTRQEMKAMAWVWVAITLGGGLAFLILPAQTIFPPPTDEALGPWRAMFRFADRANLDHNFCPSLHVAWAVAGVDIFARRAQAPGKVLLWIWAIGLCLSTMLTHQHYLVDVLAGLALAMVATRILYPRLLAWQSADRSPV